MLISFDSALHSTAFQRLLFHAFQFITAPLRLLSILFSFSFSLSSLSLSKYTYIYTRREKLRSLSLLGIKINASVSCQMKSRFQDSEVFSPINRGGKSLIARLTSPFVHPAPRTSITRRNVGRETVGENQCARARARSDRHLCTSRVSNKRGFRQSQRRLNRRRARKPKPPKRFPCLFSSDLRFSGSTKLFSPQL